MFYKLSTSQYITVSCIDLLVWTNKKTVTIIYHISYITYVIVSSQSESDGGKVEGVGDEVGHVPHVADVLLGSGVPQLLDLAPDET